MEYVSRVAWSLHILAIAFCAVGVVGCAKRPEMAPKASADAGPADSAGGVVELIARGDDMGFCHAANVACIRAYRQGILRTVEIQTCCPWFPEAAQMLRAVRHIPQVSHLSAHMGTPTCTPELRQVVERLSAEFKLPMNAEGVTGGVGVGGVAADKKEAALAAKLDELPPGRHLLVCHPALETDESRAIRGFGPHDANLRMGVHRGIVARVLIGKRIGEIIRRRGIRLMSYADTYARLPERAGTGPR